jgi:hypothetical protein
MISKHWEELVISRVCLFTGITEGKQFFNDKTWLCEALANICITSCVSSLLSIGYISINRYVYICHNAIYNHVFTRKCCAIMCLSTWIIGILLDLPSHVGWSRHEFDAKSHKCLWSRSFDYSYTVFFVTCGILIPLTVITSFYFKIFLFIGKAKKRLSHHRQDSMRKTLASTLRQAKMMCIIFVAFTTCWTPYVLVLLFDKHDTYPLEVHLFASLTAHIHASVNFIIYGFANARIRRGYVWFIKEKLCCCSSASHQAAFFSEINRNDLQLSNARNVSNNGTCNGNYRHKTSQHVRRFSLLPKKSSFFLNDAKFNSVSQSQSIDQKRQCEDTLKPEEIELQDRGITKTMNELCVTHNKETYSAMLSPI